MVVSAATVGEGMVNNIRISKESPSAMAARAIRAVSKSTITALQLDDIPPELLFGENIDFHRWSLILNDRALKILSDQLELGKEYFIDCSSPKVSGMFHSFWKKLNVPKGIISLNLVGAKDVTDYGIAVIARNNPNIKYLNISGCPNITDAGVREVGMLCTGIQELHMSSCHGVEGSGLVSIAECCRYLIKLDVSKCRKLKNWSLTKVFYFCIRLEEVNMSYLSDVTDEEVRVLAQNCPNVVSLKAIECCYLSDTSILILAQHCIDLDLLDLSRSNMAIRITDTSLLALSQKCLSLKVLRLGGCEQISDVGLTWLAEGCKVIEELDLNRCNKISDAGLRSLGQSCHSLKKLDVSFAKLITDVGLSSLSLGCPNLLNLSCHGVFMLADPRLAAPRKGAKLEAWQSLIGIAAMAENCKVLETLDLSGCFRLNAAIYQYVSSLNQIKTLNLSGCNQCTPESLEAVAKGCPLIEELSLSDCGKAVNNLSMTAFAANCKSIRSLIICRSDQLKYHGMAAISSLEKLEKLDITGCKSLNDTMLMPLSETNKIPELKSLYMGDLPLITDSILAWISMKTQNILLLALKGTSISKKAIMSVRDRFPNSEILHNDSFYGFWPKFRVDDRILINDYYSFISGMIKIQARLRAYKAKKRVANIQEERKIIAAHVLLHRVSRGYMGRRASYHKRNELYRIVNAARKITNLFRIPMAKNIMRKKRIERYERWRQASALSIQVCFRIYIAKKRLAKLMLLRQQLLEWRRFNATKIQSVARMYFSVHRIKKIKAMIRGREDVLFRKSLVIQCCYRSFKSRKITNKIRQYLKRIKQMKLEAAIKIQRKVRVLRTRGILQVIQDARAQRLSSAIKIQSLIRGALSRLYVAEIRMEIIESKYYNAAVKIQTRIRMKFATKELKTRLIEVLEAQSNYRAAANIIVNQSRVKLAHIKMRRKKEDFYNFMKEQVKRELNAVVKIQALQRGIVGRLLYREKLRERKGKWKELFDEKTKKRFFYNKLSGEIRWRMPQDLVDLIPRPSCDNCCYYDASVECAICNELYCGQCWDQVHYGGRRKDHEFRSLYDFHGRRMDYGDGEFPCKWPTEVIQDEVQGWMLRVAPLRNPLHVYTSGWEEYSNEEEIVINTLVSETANKMNPQVFFFNRNTFEAAYEVPLEVQQEKDLIALKQANLQAVGGGYYDDRGNWVSSNVYLDSWANGDGDFNVLPYPSELLAYGTGHGTGVNDQMFITNNEQVVVATSRSVLNSARENSARQNSARNSNSSKNNSGRDEHLNSSRHFSQSASQENISNRKMNRALFPESGKKKYPTSAK